MNNCKVVIFEINGEEYAIDIMNVERILGYTKPTKIPNSTYYIKGIIDYENAILPVIDLKERLSISSKEVVEESKIVVVKNNDFNFGLIVDAVLEVVDIKEDLIKETPEIASGGINDYIKSIIKNKDRIIIFLDTEKIIVKEDVDSINELV